MAMEISISSAEPAPEQWARAVVEEIAAMMQANPAARIGFPTGETPLPAYAELRRRVEAGELDVSRMRVVMLDEYLDPPNESLTSWSWLDRELFGPLRVGRERILRLPWRREGVEAASEAFELELAESGGCDLQLLGLGANGHVAFNEPGSPLNSRTRAVQLTPATAATNENYWHGEFKPDWAVTQGVSTILAARRLVLLARGGAKAAALRRALFGPRNLDDPASCLRLASSVRVLADEAAAAALPHSLDYNIAWV